MENSAVEWLEDHLELVSSGHLKIESIINQAKEMENSQRQKDFKAGNECACMEHENIEDYFNQYIKSK